MRKGRRDSSSFHILEDNWVELTLPSKQNYFPQHSFHGFQKGHSIVSFLFLIFALCYEGNGTPLQYSCLENPMDGGASWAAVHGVAKSRTRLSDFTFTFHFHALEKEMAAHSSVLAWRILGTGEPGGLPSMGSHRVGHDWSDLAAAAADPTTKLILLILKLHCSFV